MMAPDSHVTLHDRVLRVLKRALPRGVPVLCLSALCASPVQAQPCSPHWSDEFASQGVDRPIATLSGTDLGAGGELYVGGGFDNAGSTSARRIARWDGESWGPLGGGLSGWTGLAGSPVAFALHTFDDGSGSKLYVGGDFNRGGAVSSSSLIRWDGQAWNAMPQGICCSIPDLPFFVKAFAEFDDGAGSALYVTGVFFLAGGIEVNHIAKWDGTQWSALGTGLIQNPIIPIGLSLQVFDDGSGDALYVGGAMWRAGSVDALGIARWSNGEWTDVGGGIKPFPPMPPTGYNPGVSALAVYDDGGGEGLYIGGSLDGVGDPPMPISALARWDGAQWHDVVGGVTTASGAPGHVDAMAVFDDGNGPALYVGGVFEFAGGVPASNIARWDGNQWSALGLGLDDGVRALTTYDLGDGEALYIGGDFLTAGGMPSRHIAKWVGCKEPPCPSCVCDFDTTTGQGVCDIIDFVTFAGLFAAADPCACDLDTSTGVGVCDVIDFTTFAGQFAAGCP